MGRTDLLLIGFLLCVSSVVVNSQQNRQFRLCVEKPESAPECQNLNRPGSGVKCVPVLDSTDCALRIQNRTADFGMFKAEEAILASHFLESVAVIGDIRHEERTEDEFSFTAVAIVNRAKVPSNDLTLTSGLSLCHPGMGLMKSGWSDMVLKEMDLTILDKTGNLRCDEWRSSVRNEYFSIAKQWGPSCRPGTWSWDPVADKAMKFDYNSLCEKCPNKGDCAYQNSDQNNLHQATLNCLKNGGDIAYVALDYARNFIQSTPGGNQTYAYVCKNLTLSSSPYGCNFAQQPWTSIVATKEIARELSPKLHEWLKPLEPRLALQEAPERAVGGWQRALIDLLLEDYHLYNPINNMDLKTFVGRGRRLKVKQDDNVCDRKVNWCVGEAEERPKCGWLSAAAWYAGVVPEIKCVNGLSDRDCVEKVAKNEADLVVADIDLAHYGKSLKKLKPLMFVGTADDHLTSVVAVVKANSEITSFKDLKGKKACFPSYEGIGYGTFLREGLNQTLIEPKNCPYSDSVSKFFSQSCIPGAAEHNKDKPSLCALCEAKGQYACSAEPGNSFDNDVGAIKCLHNSGDVAFVRLNEILLAFQKNLLDRMLPADFKVLCKNGGQPDSTLPLGPNSIRCSLTTVPSHAVLTREGDEINKERDTHVVLNSLDSMFGLLESNIRPDQPFFMYNPFAGHRDLIFPESSSVLLSSTDKDKNVKEFLKLIRDVPRPCGLESSAFIPKPKLLFTLLFAIASLFFSRY
ncbi:lactotransferrin-like [Neocloeon triangulifer]|uniref:lactotransferrin-like n=1 Tax=Neocloeon triangulifer TaxID=2078957 RepID=UPI00286F131A|nr:lactotransferrin-like [Neocloeon triangulifer]